MDIKENLSLACSHKDIVKGEYFTLFPIKYSYFLFLINSRPGGPQRKYVFCFNLS